MFHKNAANSPAANLPAAKPNTLTLVPARGSRVAETPRLLDLAIIAARRCSSFFAEAAVLVLVFGLLDYFILKGHIDLHWIAGALAISLALLAASIATDFGAHRWIKAHP